MKKNFFNKISISIIGTDASGLDNLNPTVKTIVLSSKAIATPKRLEGSLKQLFYDNKITIDSIDICNTDQPNQLIAWLKACKVNAVVIASGDPLWYGIGKILLENIPKDQLNFYPNTTSIQLAFAHLKRPWQKASWVSLHGRDPELLIQKLKERPNELAILIDPKRGGAREVRKILMSLDLLKAYEFWIFEQLGHKHQKISKILPKDKIDDDLNPLHIVVLLANKKNISCPEKLPIIGIPDNVFLQNEELPGLMTKREIRVQLLADLNLPEQGILWDIGAGVGSIGLEGIRIRPKIKLLSIEKRYGSTNIIKENSNRLGVKPKLILEDDFIKAIEKGSISKELYFPDRVILGGGGNARLSILKIILERLNLGGIIVIPLATLEGIKEIKTYLNSIDIDPQISQHQAWRGVPLAEGTRLAPLNPVFIIKINKSQTYSLN